MEPIDGAGKFRGELLRLGRQARRMTQQDLATASHVTQAFVSMVEEDLRVPSPEQITVFAEALRFPATFFVQPDPVIGTGVGEIFHRRRKSLAGKDLERIHAWMNITTFAVRRLLRAVDWPPVDLPVWSLGADVGSEEDAAEMLRAKWYVPDGPIRSVSALLDRAGILTIPTTFGTAEMDAIGQWPSDLPPLIFVNLDAPQDRLRFTLMHEIGHLVLHQRSVLQTVSEEIEVEANRFAAAFLLPRKEIKPYLRNLNLAKLATLKRHWRVAMAALLMRAKQLETISPAEERALWVEMGRNGWRKREPEQLDVFGEEPGRRYRELVRLHRHDLGYSERTLGLMINLGEDDIHNRILPPDPGLRLVV